MFNQDIYKLHEEFKKMIGQHAPGQIWRFAEGLAHQRERGLDVESRR